MTNKLIVTKPFAHLEKGDTLTYDEKLNSYVNKYTDENESCSDNGVSISSKISASIVIDEKSAEDLVNDGYLSEVNEQKPFVNVFDEIDTLLARYKNELLDETSELRFHPAVALERKTVLNNLVTVLEHLKSLKM